MGGDASRAALEVGWRAMEPFGLVRSSRISFRDASRLCTAEATSSTAASKGAALILEGVR